MALAVAAATATVAGTPALANDRPFLLTSGALADDDAERGAWAFESWWQRAGGQRALTLAPEYAFNPFDSLQLLYTRLDDRRAAGALSSNLEFEFKHVLNDLARDGYGIGLHLSLDNARPPGGGWRAERLAGRVLLSLPFRDGDALLHLDAGLAKPRDERREWIGSAAFEHRLPWRDTHAFVEIGREDRATLLHAGLRHWVRKERFAVDLGLQQLRSEGGRRSGGWVIGVGWYGR